MGSAIYIQDKIYGKRVTTVRHMSTEEIFIEAFWNEILYPNKFGTKLKNIVPYQKPVDCNLLESAILLTMSKIEHEKKVLIGFGNSDIDYTLNMLNSITFQKIANLYRYGYRRAQKLFKDEYQYDFVDNFMDYWETFTRKTPACALRNVFETITFRVYREKNRLKWIATLNPIEPNHERVKLYDGKKFYLEDYLFEQYSNDV